MSFWSRVRDFFSCAGSRNSKQKSNDNQNGLPEGDNVNQDQNTVSDFQRQISVIVQHGSRGSIAPIDFSIENNLEKEAKNQLYEITKKITADQFLKENNPGNPEDNNGNPEDNNGNPGGDNGNPFGTTVELDPSSKTPV